ncbi:hypothetical protein LTR95_011512 [Oleoguttula sp. CCFEE 5521]
MDTSFLIPGGPDRRKQIQDAKDMAQIVARNAERHNTPLPPYQFLELIGKGSFGRVYKCLEKSTSTLVAVKIVNIDDMDFTMPLEQRDETVKDFRKEVTILKQLKDSGARNVNLIHDAFDLHSQLWIISDYCTGGSVRTLMRANAHGGLDERFIIPIARELAVAMKCVHDIDVIHRDIKCTNVYITEDGQIQLGDFGIVGIVDDNSKSKRTTIIGTPWYMPKEMHIDDSSVAGGYGKEIDIWSFGCTIYEMATGMVPNQQVPMEMLASVLEQAPRLENGNYSDGLRDFVAYCLNSDPRARPLAEQVLSHPYIAGTETQYPTRSLVALIERYAAWEYKGGQRTSLFNPGGAAAPLSAQAIDNTDQVETDDWNFSTSDDFRNDFNKRYSQMAYSDQSSVYSDHGSHFDAPAGAGLPPLNTKDLTVAERIQLEHADKSATRGEVSLDRLWNPQSAGYELHTPVDMRQPEVAKISDLPLRNISVPPAASRESSIMIDLDASPTLDAPKFNFDFDEMPTLKAKVRQSIPYDDDEVEEPNYQYGQGDTDAAKRATKDWTFPSVTAASKAAAQPKRATMEWSFASAEPAEPEETDTIMNLPPVGGSGATAPGFRPQLKHTATVPLGQFGDYLHDSQPHARIAGHSTTNSPVRNSIGSMIDLDLALDDPSEIVRPSTASSATDTTSSYETSGNPFDLEDDPELMEQDRNRYSAHRQWQSDGGVSNGSRVSLRNMAIHNRGSSLMMPEVDAARRSQVPANAEDVFGYESDQTYDEADREPFHTAVPYTAPLGNNNGNWPSFDSSNDDMSPAYSTISVPELGDPNFPGSGRSHANGASTYLPLSTAANGTRNGANGHSATIRGQQLAFPDIAAPSFAALDENASPGTLVAELDRMLGDLGDSLEATGKALQGATGTIDGEEMGYEFGHRYRTSDESGFESTTSSFDVRSGDEDGR